MRRPGRAGPLGLQGSAASSFRARGRAPFRTEPGSDSADEARAATAPPHRRRVRHHTDPESARRSTSRCRARAWGPVASSAASDGLRVDRPSLPRASGSPAPRRFAFAPGSLSVARLRGADLVCLLRLAGSCSSLAGSSRCGRPLRCWGATPARLRGPPSGGPAVAAVAGLRPGGRTSPELSLARRLRLCQCERLRESPPPSQAARGRRQVAFGHGSALRRPGRSPPANRRPQDTRRRVAICAGSALPSGSLIRLEADAAVIVSPSNWTPSDSGCARTASTFSTCRRLRRCSKGPRGRASSCRPPGS